MSKYDMLKEHALINIETLLDYWKIEYFKINEHEYDLIAKWRADENFGAVRFNTQKGIGSDFAGINVKNLNYNFMGEGFDSKDFAEFNNSTNVGFDIVGLCGKVYNLPSYKESAFQLTEDLILLSRDRPLLTPSKDAAEKRRLEKEERNKVLVKAAQKAWGSCSDKNLENSLANVYFLNRGLAEVFIREKNIRFRYLFNRELKQTIPAILFKVSIGPLTPLIAIHRIYLSEDGFKKAEVNDPKMALGSVKGAAIWFGGIGDKLCIAEGPENALSIRQIGYDFVCSSIFATNFSNLKIPNFVKEVILFPDPDEAGIQNTKKAIDTYTAQGKKVSVKFPPKVKDKALDWNDIIRELC